MFSFTLFHLNKTWYLASFTSARATGRDIGQCDRYTYTKEFWSQGSLQTDLKFLLKGNFLASPSPNYLSLHPVLNLVHPQQKQCFLPYILTCLDILYLDRIRFCILSPKIILQSPPIFSQCPCQILPGP